ncbi:site-specific integrase [Mesorhizobium sp.]|uniref:site-specific integrase n=2 Tax=unclassified Mesorhizobium TaxID=325217 RepID=UPI000FE93B4E|nr:site-specific integrase [Mesorhizobium sp.]RWG04517.1 MAG: site-specific integrase [Mesorhizobium sp.]RWG90588.1 MAG: site-specific integrase [Mesorhizobium sp.]RWH07458.1 MAG: site-specific integrase [Mesorhizobium sp.]RWH08471.1 MAG: site-specific integrase [Mesorhizobium sp.]TIN66121.1 MAG: site-specific integrase [Mesorhizobium sp.]
MTGSVLTRAEALDALDSVLPFDRREFLAEILSDDDAETLRHLAKEGIGENSMRALASDLGYLEAWSLAATGQPLPWPAPEPLLIKFIAHHLWDPSKRETDPAHGMPNEVADALRASGLLRVEGPHAPSTVRRRLSSWSTLTQWRGFAGKFNAPGLRSALKLAVRASPRPRKRKSEKAVTADVLTVLLKACAGDRLVDVRDRALLLVAFASGGRRRSEVASLRLAQIEEQDPVAADPKEPEGPKLPCAKIRLGRTKTTEANDDAFVLLVGRPVLALQEWLERAKISEGAVFRGIDRWGHLERKALTPQAVNLILKRRIAQAGLDPKVFSAHGLRSGFLTETARRGIPLPEAMQQSQHRSVSQASRYYNDAERQLGRAARLIV